jgi:hypothetical protein
VLYQPPSYSAPEVKRSRLRTKGEQARLRKETKKTFALFIVYWRLLLKKKGDNVTEQYIIIDKISNT